MGNSKTCQALAWFKIQNSKFLFLLLVLFSCSKKEDKAAEATAESKAVTTVELTQAQYDNANIELGKVSTKNISYNIQVTGMIDVPPQNLISVSAPMGGFVKSTSLLQGTHIHKGDVMAEIENPEFITLQQDYIDTKNKLSFLSQEYERQKELNKENVSSAKVFQQTTTDYKNLKNVLNALEEKLKLIGITPNSLQEGKISSNVKIKAAISGYVTAVNVNIGKYVTSNDIMFEIVDTKHVHAELNVFEKDIMNVQIGQKVKIRLSNSPQKEYSGHIHLINHKINADRTVRVHAHFDEENPAFIPSMYLDAEIETKDAKATVLPNEAVITAEGKSYIYALKTKDAKNYTFDMVEVKKGITENEFTAVVLPAHFDLANSQIVTKGAFSLLSKMLNAGEEE